MKTQTTVTAPVKFAPASQQMKLTEMLSYRAKSRHEIVKPLNSLQAALITNYYSLITQP